MSTVTLNMDRNRLRQLLAQVGSMAPETPEFPTTEKFDWRQCRYFSVDRIESLRGDMERSLREMTAVVERCCQEPFAIELVSLGQHYGSDLMPQVKAMTTGDYALPFGPTDEQLACVLVIPSASATSWANFALGASTSSDPEQADAILSSLETTFLTDLSLAMVQVFAAMLHVDQVVTAPTVGNGPVAVPWQEVDALLKITFTVKQADAEQGYEGQVILPSILIDGCKEPDADQDEEIPTAAGIVKQCMQDYPVPVCVQFGRIAMSFEELASLEPNDILMLDRRIDDPAEIQICSKKAFAGIPSQCRGRKAVLITQSYV